MKTIQKKNLVISLAALAVVAFVSWGVLAWLSFQGSQAEADPYLQPSSQTEDLESQEPQASQSTEPIQASATDSSEVDPASVSTIDVEPMGIKVAYVRGIPGFEFVVERTATGTQYVQFLSPDLAGGTCTDDDGEFAAIIKNASSDEDQTTIAESITLEGDTYGLSLGGDNCTADKDLFAEYQASFSTAFGLLERIDETSDR